MEGMNRLRFKLRRKKYQRYLSSKNPNDEGTFRKPITTYMA